MVGENDCRDGSSLTAPNDAIIFAACINEGIACDIYLNCKHHQSKGSLITFK